MHPPPPALQDAPNAPPATHARASEGRGTLYELLSQTEHVESLLRDGAVALERSNLELTREAMPADQLVALERFIATGEMAESKMKIAARMISIVNVSLRGEIRERGMVDLQLDAAIEQEGSARYAAFHDVLTGLPNRALFRDRLDHGLAQAKRHGWTVAVLFIDLDEFKAINDSHGHEVGDRVLQLIAGRIEDITREDDTVGRLGGDEFVCLLVNVSDERMIVRVVEKLIEAIELPCYIDVAGVIIRTSIRVSIGVAVFPRDGETATALISNADRTMYAAKLNKCGYLFAQPS